VQPWSHIGSIFLLLLQVFTPMLASASVGTVEYRSMTESVRDANPMIDQYIQGTVTGQKSPVDKGETLPGSLN
jgi:hypothetical protein